MGFYKILASSYRLTNIFSSKNFRKILIFIFIGLCLFLLFSNNAFAYESVSFSTLNASLDTANNVIIEPNNNDSTIFYFKSDSKYIYTLKNTSPSVSVRIFYTAENIAIGSHYNFVVNLGPGEEYTFIGHDEGYFYSRSDSSVPLSWLTVSREPLNGVNLAVDNMLDEFNLSNLWSQIGFAVPLIAVALLFALGFGIVKKLNKGESKSKVKF